MGKIARGRPAIAIALMPTGRGSPHARLFKQGGDFLIGTVLLIAVVGVLATWAISETQRQVRLSIGSKVGGEMAMLNDAIRDFTNRYALDIAKQIVKAREHAPPNQLIEITLQPSGQTVFARHLQYDEIEMNSEQLKFAMDILMLPGIPSRPSVVPDGRYKLRFRLAPDASGGGSCDSRTERRRCFVDTLLYIDKPLHVTPLVLQAAVNKAGAGSGFAEPDFPGASTGQYMRFVSGHVPLEAAVPNPVPGKPVGVLAVLGSLSGQYRSFVELRHGSLQGDIDMGDHNVLGVSKLSVGRIELSDNSIKAPTLSFDSRDVTLQDSANSSAKLLFKDGTVIASRVQAAHLQSDEITFRTTVAENTPCTGRQIGYGSEKLLFCHRKGLWTALPSGDQGRPGENGKLGDPGARGRKGPRGNKGKQGMRGDSGRNGADL